jgi:hypothetical protein
MKIEPAAVSALDGDILRVVRRVELAPRDAAESLGFASARSECFSHRS